MRKKVKTKKNIFSYPSILIFSFVLPFFMYLFLSFPLARFASKLEDIQVNIHEIELDLAEEEMEYFHLVEKINNEDYTKLHLSDTIPTIYLDKKTQIVFLSGARE